MTTAGVLLAGGASRRFGSEKAVAAYAGGLLMELPLQALALSCDRIAVSASATLGASAIAAACEYPVLEDPVDAPAGPLAGILAALRWAQAEGAELLAVAPCDAPTVTAEQVQRLAALASPSRAAAAESAQGLEPLLAVWPVARALTLVERALADGHHPSVRSLLERLGVVRVAGFDGVNVNAATDLPDMAAEAIDEPPHARLFGFEADFVRTLRCIPMCVRFKLDRAAIKLSLRQWSRFTLADRQRLRRLPCGTPAEIEAYRGVLIDLIALRSGDDAKTLGEAPPTAWRDREPPAAVVAMAHERQTAPVTQDVWRGLNDLQRYALIKLTRDKHENANFPLALIEFGVVRRPVLVEAGSSSLEKRS
jgi:hypothetical protein